MVVAHAWEAADASPPAEAIRELPPWPAGVAAAQALWTEQVTPGHGADPWPATPQSLLVQAQDGDDRRFANTWAYAGRDGRNHVLNLTLTTTDLSIVQGEIVVADRTVTLAPRALDPLGAGAFRAIWQNLFLPGAGVTQLTAFLQEDA